MILGVSYNLFEGEELLEASIRQIRDRVDYISVIYQTISYYGEPCSDNLLYILDSLKEKNYIDELYEYRPNLDLSFSPKKGHLEHIAKRNIGLELCKKRGCNYHMTMDVDEFYLPNEFDYMKNIIEEGKEKSLVCACQHSQYYKDSIYKTYPIEQEYIQGIFKIEQNTKFAYDQKSPVPIDPSRKVNNEKYLVLSRNNIEMRHLSFVRKSIKRKLLSSCARINISDKIEKIIEHYNTWCYPEPAMWAGGDLRHVKKIDRLFEPYL